jgi:hypothetical protein
MAGVIDRVTTADQYGTTAATGVLQNIWTGRGGSLQIANAAVFYQLQYGIQGADHWTPEAYLAPSVGSIEAGTAGIRFRSYVAGTPAIVFATIAEGHEPIVSGQQFAGTVAASGQVVPPVSGATLITDSLLANPAATIPLSSISQTFSNLFIDIDALGTTLTNDNVFGMQFNGDVGGTYYGRGYVSGGAGLAGFSNTFGGQAQVFAPIGVMNSTVPSAYRVQIPGYRDAGLAGHPYVSVGAGVGGGSLTDFRLAHAGGVWVNGAAISSILLVATVGSFASGTRVSLYGE